MMKYESKKNPGTFLTTDGVVDPKTKTVFVTMDDGKEKTISVATLKRWWTKIEDGATAEPKAPAQEAQAEEAAASVEEKPAVIEEAAPAEEEAAPATAEQIEAEAPAKADTPAEETPEEKPVKTPKTPKVGKAPKAKVEKETDTPTADSAMKMSEAIQNLETISDKLNALYFDGTLAKPVITVQSTPRAYGHCSTKKIWKNEAENEAMYEINIGAEFLNRPIEVTAATLLHEMVHLNCMENGISDTCQNGRYHNGNFKKECEARDLTVEYDRANGHAYTSPTDAFTEKIKAAGIDMSIKFARILPTKRAKAARVMFTYTCPKCGQTFRSAENLNIKCGDCDVAMERA